MEKKNLIKFRKVLDKFTEGNCITDWCVQQSRCNFQFKNPLTARARRILLDERSFQHSIFCFYSCPKGQPLTANWWAWMCMCSNPMHPCITNMFDFYIVENWKLVDFIFKASFTETADFQLQWWIFKLRAVINYTVRFLKILRIWNEDLEPKLYSAFSFILRRYFKVPWIKGDHIISLPPMMQWQIYLSR